MASAMPPVCRAMRALPRMAPLLNICKPRNMLSPVSFAGAMLDPDNQAKVLQGKRPGKARSPQHARADAHTASNVAPRVFAV
ncbi:MAG: hypothetical protein ACSLE9_06845, partial [Burkholderiaceae bacterium]